MAKTTLPNRFEISRNQTGLWGLSPKIDRWCDIDGGVLAELLDHLRRPKEKNPDVFAKLLGKTDSIALVIPARVIVEAWKQEQAQQDLGEFLPGIRQFIQNHLPRKNWLGWDKCQKTLVISQSARIVANEKQRSTLRDGLEWFTGYTGLNNLMKCTFIVDSIPEEAKQFEVVPARLAENGRGKRFRVDNSGAAVCSAGVVLAWMLKRLDPAALDSAFVVKV